MISREQLAEDYPDLLFVDGHDDALIGVAHRFGMEPVALYDRGKIIEKLVKESNCHADHPCLEEEACDACYMDAEEFFAFNILGGWHGEMTPVFADIATPEKRSWVTPQETIDQIEAFYKDI